MVTAVALRQPVHVAVILTSPPEAAGLSAAVHPPPASVEAATVYAAKPPVADVTVTEAAVPPSPSTP